MSVIVGVLLATLMACKTETSAGPNISVEDVWSRPAIAIGEMSDGDTAGETGTDHGKSSTGAIFMKLVNKGRGADRLLGAQVDMAEAAEIHETRIDGDVMKMRMVPEGLEIPARGEVLLKPGGYHIMLIGLKHDLKVGDRLSVVLRFEVSDPLTVEAEVREP